MLHYQAKASLHLSLSQTPRYLIALLVLQAEALVFLQEIL